MAFPHGLYEEPVTLLECIVPPASIVQESPYPVVVHVAGILSNALSVTYAPPFIRRVYEDARPGSLIRIEVSYWAMSLPRAWFQGYTTRQCT